MNIRYRYHNYGTAPLKVRSLLIRHDEYFYSDVPLFSDEDLAANPTIVMDTDLNMDGTWVFAAGDVNAPVEAGNVAGNKSEAAVAYATPIDNDPPADVTDGAATAGDTLATLTWVDPVDADLDHIEITHDQTGGATPQIVAAGVQTLVAEELTNDTLYTFTIKAVDVNGNKSAGATVTVTPTV